MSSAQFVRTGQLAQAWAHHDRHGKQTLPFKQQDVKHWDKVDIWYYTCILCNIRQYWMQEHTKSTHRDEKILTQKKICVVQPAAHGLCFRSPWKKPLFRFGHSFLGSLCSSACQTCKKCSLCDLKTASNVDIVVAAVKKIWQGLAKIRPNL